MNMIQVLKCYLKCWNSIPVFKKCYRKDSTKFIIKIGVSFFIPLFLQWLHICTSNMRCEGIFVRTWNFACHFNFFFYAKLRNKKIKIKAMKLTTSLSFRFVICSAIGATEILFLGCRSIFKYSDSCMRIVLQNMMHITGWTFVIRRFSIALNTAPVVDVYKYAE